uniref:Uncharacterized protein n=1 Tax=Peronospora matthiolae TaxID=2874970 RepID=A0AAV1U7S0_9STRA
MYRLTRWQGTATSCNDEVGGGLMAESLDVSDVFMMRNEGVVYMIWNADVVFMMWDADVVLRIWSEDGGTGVVFVD